MALPVASTSAASFLDSTNIRTAPVRVREPSRPPVQARSATPVVKSDFRYSEPLESRQLSMRSASVPPVPVSTSRQPSAEPRPPPVARVPSPSKTSAKGKGKAKDEEVPSVSLLRSLHGPSAGKAGLLRDPEEVKRIIFEASKGSKYFQAQQQKDVQLTQRVDKLVAHLSKLVKERGGNLKAEEDRVDDMIREMEKERVLTETVVVVDADAFYASCHERQDPTLVGKAFGVGKGVLTTASYAARKWGCSSAMAGFVASQLCPQLIFVPCDFKLYIEASRSIMDILRQYGETSPASLDEAYISLTDYCKREKVTPAEAAERMRAQVFAETRLTVSAGVSPNAMLSKVAADMNKPNGQCVIDPNREACMAFSASLPVRKIPGIGRVSERILQAVGIMTVADVYKERGKLFLIRGQIGLTFLLRAYLGLGRTQIKQAERGSRKGISVERTFRAESDLQSLYDRLKLIADGLADDCEKTEYSGRTLTLKLKTHTFQSISRAKTLGSAIYFSDAATFYTEGKKLLDKELADRKALIARGGTPKGGKEFSLRLIGLRLSNLRDERATQDAGKLDSWAGSKKKKKSSKRENKQSRADDDAGDDVDGDNPDNFADGFASQLDVEDPNDTEEAEMLAALNDEYGGDGDGDGEGDVAESGQPKASASSDPLWASLGGLDDVDFPDEETFYNPIDRPMDYKPFFTAGESLNSRKERDAPASMKDRLSFEQKVKAEDEDTTEGSTASTSRGPLTCPVCSKTFVGSELALSAHVAAHFEDEEEDLKPVKKKVKKERSGSTSKSTSARPAKPTAKKGQAFNAKQSGRVDSIFAKRS